MTRRLAVLCTLLMLATMLTVFPSVPASSSVTPGGVFVTGHDPDFHSIAGNTTGARNILRRAVGYVTFDAPSPTMLLVTSRITPPAGHIDTVAGMTAAGFTFDVAAAPDQLQLDLTTVDFNAYDVVVVGSDFGGLLRQAELDILNARSADLINFVNNGGGLVALAETNGGARLTPAGGHFDFLPFLATELTHHQSEVNYTLTPFGTSLGLTTSDINGNVSHSVFTSTGGLNVVDQDGAGRPVSLAIRGVEICTGGAPQASITDVALNEGNAGDVTSFTFAVSLDVDPCGAPVTLDYSTADGTATAGDDYSTTVGTLTFDPGVTSQNITVPVLGDNTFEPDETFFVNLTNPSNATLLDGQGLGTLLNDDPENQAPDCSSVTATPATLWPPRHDLQDVTLAGALDADGDSVSLRIVGVSQDEALDGTGDGDTAPDAVAGAASNSVLLRAERAGDADGRVYRISFEGTDPSGAACTGVVTLGVPRSRDGGAAVDSGQVFNSFGP